ncbi:MAB_1171c family putative transporter [Streptomyces sp. NPDC060031]|uniref:MAB_1171c family putative transporter n=1 Tax=Streptomyces sp. NPDC060031 TaxID=3347043 RepID=UPI0036CC1DB8
MTESLILYVPGLVIAAALIVKAPTLRRGWDQPLMRAVCTLLAVGSLAVFLSAPPTIVLVNRLTGIVNFSAPLVYSLLTAFSGASIVLILYWGGTPTPGVRRTIRVTVAAYSAVIVLIVALFAKGDAPVERLRDMDTYYANTPWIREMIVCYLVAHTVGSTALTLLCRKWLRRLTPAAGSPGPKNPMRPLRTGLALLMLGGAMDMAFVTVKWIAVGAHWSGRDWDGLSTYGAPPIAATAALLVGTGFIVPLVGGSAAWRDFSEYRRLQPLWAALRGFAASSVMTVPMTWWSPVGIRLIHRESVIDDGILALACWFDPAVRSRAHEAALAQGLTEREASLVADAAMLAAACQHRAAADRAGDGCAGPGAGLGCPAPYRMDSHRLDSQPLAELAQEFRASPIVAAARRRASGV